MSFVAFLMACNSDPAPPPEGTPVGFTLAYQGGVDGEIEPCG